MASQREQQQQLAGAADDDDEDEEAPGKTENEKWKYKWNNYVELAN